MSKTDTPNSTPTEPQTALNYCPSVPISVYRELVGELRQTQAQLAILKSQNQQLRQEAKKVFHSTHTLKQVVDSFDPYQSHPAVAPLTEVQIAAPELSESPTDLKPTVEVASSNHSAHGSSVRPLNRWTLVLIFGAIGLSAFMLGFFVVPTLVKPNSR